MRTPIIAAVSAVVFDYRSNCQAYTQCFPELVGRTYSNVPFFFDDATVIGIVPENETQGLSVKPGPTYRMQVWCWRVTGSSCLHVSVGCTAASMWCRMVTASACCDLHTFDRTKSYQTLDGRSLAKETGSRLKFLTAGIWPLSRPCPKAVVVRPGLPLGKHDHVTVGILLHSDAVCRVGERLQWQEERQHPGGAE